MHVAHAARRLWGKHGRNAVHDTLEVTPAGGSSQVPSSNQILNAAWLLQTGSKRCVLSQCCLGTSKL